MNRFVECLREKTCKCPIMTAVVAIVVAFVAYKLVRVVAGMKPRGGPRQDEAQRAAGRRFVRNKRSKRN